MSYTIDDNGLLQGNDVEHQLTDKHSGRFASSQPDTILMHYTGGSTLGGAVSHLANPNVQASAHLVIGRDGKVVQMVPFNHKAWHAGRSSYQGRSGYNQYSIGIEMVNAGPLKQVGNQFVSSFGKKYDADEVVQATHRNESTPRFWQIYTEAQMECVQSVCLELVKTYDIQMILGHEEVAPTRKTDPGPAFPLDLFRDQFLSARSEEAEYDDPSAVKEEIVGHGLVTATKLNIRDTPSVHSHKIREPLNQGQKLEILKERSGWYKVRLSEVGWVKKDYVKRT